MVASRKKIKQVSEGEAEALKVERRSKVKKRKELKQQQAKEAAKISKENGEAVENSRKKKKKRKQKEQDDTEKSAEAESKKNANEHSEEQPKRKKKKEQEEAKKNRMSEVNEQFEIPEEELVLNVSNSRIGDELADDTGEIEPATKRKAERAVEAKRRKKGDKRKKLDKWGAPVLPAEVQSEERNEENHQEETLEHQEQYEPRKLYVGGMPYYTSEDDIHNYFAECGAIEELDCSTFPDTGRFRGIAFITFKTEAAASKALELDGAYMDGRYLRIQKCKVRPAEASKQQMYKEPPRKTDGCLSVYIGNLSWDVTEEDVRAFFKHCNIKAVRFAVDKGTEEFKGYGHVDFLDDHSVEAAVKLDQQLLLQRPMKVAYAVPPRKKSDEAKKSDASRECHVCGERGHIAFQCPKNAS